MRRVSLWLCSATIGAALLAGFSYAQSPASAQNAAPAPKMEVHATLAQLMRGILYPASNVVFAAQSDDPAKVKPAANQSMSPDLLSSTYGQWQAVENSALAITETANLLTLPGRKCSNGLDVPVRNGDWAKFVQELRAAGLAAYKAAQSKNQDEIVTAADPLTTACSNCHEKYREKPNLSERCK
jgi:hypothetical protein